MSAEKIASQAYLEVAAAHGVEYIFGLPGTSGQEFIGTIADQEKIRFILAMHETCVVSMADGHARVTGRPQLAQVSTLPGSANSVGALYDAYRDRSPVIVTSTNVDTRIDGRDSHTEGKNLVEMTKQFTKWSAEVHRADRIPEYLNRAFKVASSAPTGPVYLALPSNLLGESINVENPDAERSRVSPRIAGDPEAFADAAKMLAHAKRPLIVAGSAIAKAHATEDLIKFAEMVAAPVVMEPRYSFLVLSNHASAEFSNRRAPTLLRSTRMGRTRRHHRNRLPLDPRISLYPRTGHQTVDKNRPHRRRPLGDRQSFSRRHRYRCRRQERAQVADRKLRESRAGNGSEIRASGMSTQSQATKPPAKSIAVSAKVGTPHRSTPRGSPAPWTGSSRKIP